MKIIFYYLIYEGLNLHTGIYSFDFDAKTNKKKQTDILVFITKGTAVLEWGPTHWIS